MDQVLPVPQKRITRCPLSGVPQKISYLCIPVLIIFMFFTGLCLWPPCANMPLFEAAIAGPRWRYERAHHPLLHDVRVHRLYAASHAYLANIEGLAPSMLMFFGKEHGGLTYDIEKHNISRQGRPGSLSLGGSPEAPALQKGSRESRALLLAQTC